MKRLLAVLTAFSLAFSCAVRAGAGNTTETADYIALTFDDGPSGAITEKLLDGLAARNGTATFLICGYRSISPNTIVNRTTVTSPDRGEEVAIDVLAANQPAKLYILLGTNALVQTGNEDSFINYYARMLDELRAALPNTTFYVQSILCATQETVEDDAPGLSPDHIGPINQQIKALCEERGLYYLDLNAEFSDENGYLLTDYAQPDGIHLTVSGYNKWVSYLCTHTPYSKNNPYQSGSTYYLSEEMQSQLADLP